ncbi:hypothetical protein Cci01nite_31670 [Catellatospora citrea]|uniref:Uncharacterized protein n=1 Tax=Catellatospora citrea TaxID=53366 RepID=A0A8J3KJ38_9ACTN|nr:hypothetical protein Cci01nite_31670 [Catellatospora citrea]
MDFADVITFAYVQLNGFRLPAYYGFEGVSAGQLVHYEVDIILRVKIVVMRFVVSAEFLLGRLSLFE